MAILNRIKLLITEQKLYHGAFGKYSRYRCWCLKRNAKTAAEKMAVATEVLASGGVTTMEAQYNELYIKRHSRATEVEVSKPLATTATMEPIQLPLGASGGNEQERHRQP